MSISQSGQSDSSPTLVVSKVVSPEWTPVLLAFETCLLASSFSTLIVSFCRYKLSIDAPSISYSAEYTVTGDKTTFIFSKLPDIVGTGEKYTVKVECLVTPAGSDKEVSSVPLQGTFTTRPLAPTNFRVEEESGELAWLASPTPNVSAYKVRWRSTEEGSTPEEVLLPVSDTFNCATTLKVIMIAWFD